jgi:hypothetical protein
MNIAYFQLKSRGRRRHMKDAGRSYDQLQRDIISRLIANPNLEGYDHYKKYSNTNIHSNKNKSVIVYYSISNLNMTCVHHIFVDLEYCDQYSLVT